MYFKGARKKLPEIARELKVQAVVEPSVQRAGARLLVNFQLVHGPTDRHLWAKSYEIDSSDLQSLLPSVARDILEAMNVQLATGETPRPSVSRHVTPEAYEAYLRARFHLGTGTQHGRTRAEEYFKKAIELDPNNAEAYAGLARLYTHGGAFLAGGDLPARAKTREYGERALKLDPNNAEAYTAFAFADLADWDFHGAEQNFKQAIEQNPNQPTARVWYSQFLGAMLRFDEAFAQAERARQLVPLEVASLAHAAVPYWQSGKVDEAERRFQEIVDLDPGYWFGHHLLALAHLQRGKYAEAIAALQKSMLLREANPSGPASPYGEWRNLGVLAYAYAKGGRREEALKTVSDMERREKAGQIRASAAIAIAHVGLGNHNRALDWLEYWYKEHGAGLFMLSADPFYEPLRPHPRFRALLRRIGLPDGNAPTSKGTSEKSQTPQGKR
jgi:tetratricopeptide (TPR) repeat protein